MKKSLKIFKRITCVLGILFIVLGAVPISEVSQVSEVSAETLSLPSFSSVNLFDSLSEDGQEPPVEEPPADEPPGDEPPGDGPPGDEPPGDEPPGDEPPGDEPPGGESPADDPPEDGSGEDGECEGEDCDDGGGEEDDECEGEDCPEIIGIQAQGACRQEGWWCGGIWGDCCDGLTCEGGVCVQSCIPNPDCPTECGYGGGMVPDGCGGTDYCEPTDACPCMGLNQWCDQDHECCEGLICEGHSCKVPPPACRTAGQNCGGHFGSCCEGLACTPREFGPPTCRVPEPQCQEAGQRCGGSYGECCGNMHCSSGGTGPPICRAPEPQCQGEGQICVGSDRRCCEGLVCATGGSGPPLCRVQVDCEGHWSECEGECGTGTKTYIIDVEPQYGGAACEYAEGAEAQCPLDPCPVDCVGGWGECVGVCGEGTRTYHIYTPAENGGAACEHDEGYTEPCPLDPCPIDCVGSWSECEGECGTEGTRTYTITVEAEHGGQECEADNGATEPCQTDPCPEDCVGEWSACEGECGQVTGQRTYTVISPAAYGGAECEAEDGEVDDTCLTDPCPIDCVGSWSAGCTNGCGEYGIKTFTIEVEAAWGGEECEAVNGQTRECKNYDCPPPPPEFPVGGAGGGVIPVTGAGGPTEELVIIPVTGVDLGVELAGFQKLFLYMGLMLFGITMVLEGVTRKYKI